MYCPSIFNCQRSRLLHQQPEHRTALDSVFWLLIFFGIASLGGLMFNMTQTLRTSQLSPACLALLCEPRQRLVGLGRIELPTSPLSGVRSSQLSYRPGGFQSWWSWSGSNRRPPECKSGALPAELQPLKFEAALFQSRLKEDYRGRLEAAVRHQAEPANNLINI